MTDTCGSEDRSTHTKVRSRFGRALRFLLGAVLVVACVSWLQAGAPANWPQFRGLTGGVIPDDPQLPEHWSRTENVAWRADVPGQGWGSPIVWGDYVFVTSVSRLDKDEPATASPGAFAANLERKEMMAGVTPDLDYRTERQWVLYAF